MRLDGDAAQVLARKVKLLEHAMHGYAAACAQGRFRDPIEEMAPMEELAAEIHGTLEAV